jgi:hypothetical protein
MANAPSTHPPALDNEPVELRFELTEADMAAFYRNLEEIDLASSREWKRIRRSFRISVAVAVALTMLLVFGFATDLFGMASIEGRPVLALGLAAAVVGAWYTAAQYRTALKPISCAQYAAAWASTPESRYHLGPQTLTLAPSGVTLSTIHHDITQRWSGITDIRETSHAIYINRIDRVCYMIPKRIFEGPDAAAAVLTCARHWLDHCGHGNRRRILEHLATSDAPCPNCRYNLRGITTPVCPECGREIDITIVPVATA